MKLNYVILTLLFGLFGNLCFAQTSVTKAKKDKTQKTQSDWEKTWYVKAKATATFDSNFDHEPIGTKSYGFIPSLEFGYQLEKDKNRWQFQYRIGRPNYAKFSQYNQIGQYFRTAYKHNFGKGWSAETEGEVSLRAFDEDRQNNNQFTLTQKLNYKVTKKDKISLIGAYRIKRDQDDPNQNAKNPQIGFKYSRQFTNKVEGYGSFRYENNIAQGERQRYVRRTFNAGVQFTPTTRDWFNVEARYAPRKYGRLIEVDGQDVPRLDKKLSFDVNWRHECKSNWGMENSYSYEKRYSNDPDKIYKNHQMVVSLFYRWGNGKDQ